MKHDEYNNTLNSLEHYWIFLSFPQNFSGILLNLQFLLCLMIKILTIYFKISFQKLAFGDLERWINPHLRQPMSRVSLAGFYLFMYWTYSPPFYPMNAVCMLMDMVMGSCILGLLRCPPGVGPCENWQNTWHDSWASSGVCGLCVSVLIHLFSFRVSNLWSYFLLCKEDQGQL